MKGNDAILMFTETAQNEGILFDYQWMKGIVGRLKEEMGWNELESQNTYRVSQVSLGLVCEYTKARLKFPVRTRNCRHVYCLEREVMEEVGECGCGEGVSGDNPIQPAKTIQAIMDYINRYNFPHQTIMVIFSHNCFFPIHKTTILYSPHPLLQ